MRNQIIRLKMLIGVLVLYSSVIYGGKTPGCIHCDELLKIRNRSFSNAEDLSLIQNELKFTTFLMALVGIAGVGTMHVGRGICDKKVPAWQPALVGLFYVQTIISLWRQLADSHVYIPHAQKIETKKKKIMTLTGSCDADGHAYLDPRKLASWYSLIARIISVCGVMCFQYSGIQNRPPGFELFSEIQDHPPEYKQFEGFNRLLNGNP